MVVGKNTPKIQRAVSTGGPALPPLRKLAVRRPNAVESNPCTAVMATVLGCWASQGYTAQGCASLEQQLRTCMDAKRATGVKKNQINQTLSRFYPQIIGPHKRK